MMGWSALWLARVLNPSPPSATLEIPVAPLARNRMHTHGKGRHLCAPGLLECEVSIGLAAAVGSAPFAVGAVVCRGGQVALGHSPVDRQNVVHCDILPAHPMFEPATPSVKVTDFGIACIPDANPPAPGASRLRTGPLRRGADILGRRTAISADTRFRARAGSTAKPCHATMARSKTPGSTSFPVMPPRTAAAAYAAASDTTAVQPMDAAPEQPSGHRTHATRP